MRPLPIEDIADLLQIFAEGDNPFDPCPDARYLFGDDNSNWAGVFVSGPLAGKWLFLDHDEPEWTPRFASTESFVASLVEAARTGGGWESMGADYPLARDAAPALIEDARPLSAHYLAELAGANDPTVARHALLTAFHLLPPDETATLRLALTAPERLVSVPHIIKAVRLAALQVVEHQLQAALIPEVRAVAATARKGDDYTLWSAAFGALRASSDDEGMAREREAAPRKWPSPRARR